jgi:hypothetical protein
MNNILRIIVVELQLAFGAQLFYSESFSGAWLAIVNLTADIEALSDLALDVEYFVSRCKPALLLSCRATKWNLAVPIP